LAQILLLHLVAFKNISRYIVLEVLKISLEALI
jgi:hypothetical protein